MEDQEFNKRELLKALYLATDQNYDRFAIYTHGWLETGAFTCTLCPAHNYWGIKFNPKYGAHFVEKVTHEIVNGKEITITDKFQSFSDPYQAVNNYLFKIKKMYPQAYLCRSDYAKYYDGLMSGPFKWSTSPNYANTLKNLYDRLSDSGAFIE